MKTSKKYISRTYWENYINSIISSIEEDKDTLIDMLIYGNLSNAEIVMTLCAEQHPCYTIKVKKIGRESPFGEDEEE